MCDWHVCTHECLRGPASPCGGRGKACGGRALLMSCLHPPSFRDLGSTVPGPTEGQKRELSLHPQAVGRLSSHSCGGGERVSIGASQNVLQGLVAVPPKGPQKMLSGAKHTRQTLSDAELKVCKALWAAQGLSDANAGLSRRWCSQVPLVWVPRQPTAPPPCHPRVEPSCDALLS